MTSRRTQVQNHPAHSCHDILTITGCGMTDDEVARHLEVNMGQIARWSNYAGNKRRLARAA